MLQVLLVVFWGLLVLHLVSLTSTLSIRQLVVSSSLAVRGITADEVDNIQPQTNEAVGGLTEDLVPPREADKTLGGLTEEFVAQGEADNTLGGLLLSPELFEDSRCISRSREYQLRKPSTFKPSPYLISKLRDYERRHLKCAHEAKKFSPQTNATEQDFGGCRFIVWMAISGLGNRIMTLTSAFVYALLTNRVLIVDRGLGTDELFCEPFPSTSWLLPESFPNEWMNNLGSNSTSKFGFLARNFTFTSSHNGYSYIDIMHSSDKDDTKFFCANCPSYLSSFPWLFMRSNQYFLPGLHLVPEFHDELDKMFPERQTVFHHIVRYLMHPSDAVWGLISSFYETHLANSQHKVGLQIRVLSDDPALLEVFPDLVLKCAQEKKLLPDVALNTNNSAVGNQISNSVSVLVASLRVVFYNRIRELYLNHPTTDGQQVGVYTASHDEVQFLNFLSHDMKALADMYLLSFSDTLVTTSWSTFGYVAQGISGVNPWILTKFDTTDTVPEYIKNYGICNRGISIDPCFHNTPQMDCENRGWTTDPGKMLPYIQHCEDVPWGIKIMDPATGGH